MTAIPGSPTTYRGYAEVDELLGLARILDPDIHAVVWRRPPIAAIVDGLARSEWRFGSFSRHVGPATDPKLRDHIAGLLPRGAEQASPAGAAALLDDVEDLCGAFSDLVAAEELLISFEAPTTASCPRFHVDRIGIRMLVTYSGPGTEILPDECADRSWLGMAGHGLKDEESGILRPGAEILTADRFAVVLLKGSAWPNTEGFGAIHRSPDPGTATRVVLRVDMLRQLQLQN